MDKLLIKNLIRSSISNQFSTVYLVLNCLRFKISDENSLSVINDFMIDIEKFNDKVQNALDNL